MQIGKGEMKNGRHKIIEIKDYSKQIQELLVITVRDNVQMAKTEHKESLKSENKEEDEV